MRRLIFGLALVAGLVVPQALGLAQSQTQGQTQVPVITPVTPVSGQTTTPVVPVVNQPAPSAPATPTGPRLQLTFEPGGKMTLIANGATLREIIDEWTRKGNTPFVGADRLPGGPQTLQLEHQNEVDVISSLLRSASGYVLAPRREGSTGASQFEAVYVVAQSNSSAVASSAGFQSYTQPTVSTVGNPDEEISPARPAPGPQQPPAPPAPSAPRPSGVSGVAVPVVPVVPVGSGSSTTTPPPPTTGTGRGGGGGGGGR